MKAIKRIDAAEVLRLMASGHVVVVYPRKGVVVVNGFERFKATGAAIKAARDAMARGTP